MFDGSKISINIFSFYFKFVYPTISPRNSKNTPLQHNQIFTTDTDTFGFKHVISMSNHPLNIGNTIVRSVKSQKTLLLRKSYEQTGLQDNITHSTIQTLDLIELVG